MIQNFESKISVSKLPEELMLSVLTFQQDFEAASKTANVCKQMKKLIHDLIEESQFIVVDCCIQFSEMHKLKIQSN